MQIFDFYLSYQNQNYKSKLILKIEMEKFEEKKKQKSTLQKKKCKKKENKSIFLF